MSPLFQFAQNVKWRTALSLERERERKIRRRLFTSSIKREIRHFHVIYSCNNGKEMHKKNVMHVQSRCFTSLTYYVFDVLVAVAVVVAKAPYFWQGYLLSA